jgi:hypothetical protein
MAIQLINIGFNANDGTGDDLREAFIKVNQNFEELDLRDDERTTAVNLGTAGEGVFAQDNNYQLEFKRLVAGKDIVLTSNPQRILIEANGGLKRLLVQSNSGSIILEEVADISLLGGENINTSIVDGIVTIDYTGPTSLVDDEFPTLGAQLNANGKDINFVATLAANNVVSNVVGNLTGLVHNIDIRDINQYFNNYFDFGEISKTINSIIDWMLVETVVDMGTIGNPDLKTIDGGSI